MPWCRLRVLLCVLCVCMYVCWSLCRTMTLPGPAQSWHGESTSPLDRDFTAQGCPETPVGDQNTVTPACVIIPRWPLLCVHVCVYSVCCVRVHISFVYRSLIARRLLVTLVACLLRLSLACLFVTCSFVCLFACLFVCFVCQVGFVVTLCLSTSFRYLFSAFCSCLFVWCFANASLFVCLWVCMSFAAVLLVCNYFLCLLYFCVCRLSFVICFLFYFLISLFNCLLIFARLRC